MAKKAEAKLETVELRDVEICRTGLWNGIEWTTADFQTAISNFEDNLCQVPLILTQDGEHGRQHIRMPGGASLGWASKLWLDGDTLKANFKGVPKYVGELIEATTFGQKSIEGWTDFITADGEHHGRIIDGVLFFGVGVPAVHGLSDLVKLYEQSAEPQTAGRFSCSASTPDSSNPDARGDADDPPESGPPDDSNADVNGGGGDPTQMQDREPQGGNTVADETKVALTNDRYAELVAAEAKIEHMNSRMEEAEAKAVALKADLESVTKERDTLKAKVEEHDAEKVRMQNDALTAAIDKLVTDGKLEPAKKDGAIAYCKMLAADDRAEYLKKLDAAPSIFLGGTSTPAAAPAGTGDPMDEVHQKALALTQSTGMPYAEAKRVAMQQMGG